ncbi:MAG: tetratricopeptide repeat protein [Planctomycetota bacterium]
MVSLLLVLMPLLAAGDPEAAAAAFKKGDPAAAIDLLGDLPEAAGASVDVLKLTGRAYLALGRPMAASDPLLRASDLAPSDKELAALAARASKDAGLADGGPSARAYLDDAKRLAKRSGQPLPLGEILLLLRDFEPALEQFDLAKKDEASRLAALRGRADCLAGIPGREKDHQTARRELMEAALEEGELKMAYAAAFASDAGGRVLVWLTEKLTEKPDDMRLRRYRGFARARLLLFAEAAEDLRPVVKKAPHDIPAKNMLAYALMQMYAENQDLAALDEAIGIGRDVVTRDPANRTTRDRLSWAANIRFTNGDTAGAAELLGFLHEKAPEDTIVALDLGAMLRRLHRYDEARAAYRRALEEFPDDPDVLNDLAILEDGAGNRAEAVRLWNSVLVEDDENLNALENLCTAAWEAGDTDRLADLVAKGLQVAIDRKKTVDRWKWFRDRLLWAERGHAYGSEPRREDRGDR